MRYTDVSLVFKMRSMIKDAVPFPKGGNGPVVIFFPLGPVFFCSVSKDPG